MPTLATRASSRRKRPASAGSRWWSTMRGVRDVERPSANGSDRPSATAEVDVRPRRERRLDPARRVEDLRPAVDGRHVDRAPRASRAGKRQWDVARPGADVENPQRITFGGGVRRHERAQRAERKVRAAEAAIDAPEVAQVAIEDSCVREGAIEVLPSVGQAAHRRNG